MKKNQKNNQSLLHMMKILIFNVLKGKAPKLQRSAGNQTQKRVAYFQLLKGTLQQKVSVYKVLWSIIVEKVTKFYL